MHELYPRHHPGLLLGMGESFTRFFLGQRVLDIGRRYAQLGVVIFAVALCLLGAARGQTVTVAAAGDIACSPTAEVTADQCQMAATAELILAKQVDAVLALGDLQYPQGDSGDFANAYDKSWGRFKEITYPVPGNHEYYLYDAQGYYRYFGRRAQREHHGTYSFNLGNWHVIALNSNCLFAGGCGLASDQIALLKEDLRTHPNRCTLAYWHHPRFSSGSHGSNDTYQALWNVLAEAGVELVLNAHDHHYERFAPQLGDGTRSARGIRAFVVGTGGKSLYDAKTRQPNSVAIEDRAFGVLFLTLAPKRYTWSFGTIPAGEVADQGQGRCH
jgi:3',5'-cyclic AMP phosphodiesterase CpdA